MKLLCIFAAVLALSIAEEDNQALDDLIAAETIELQKEGHDLKPEASVYNFAPPNQQVWNQQMPQTWYPPQAPSQPQHTYVPANTVSPPQNDYYVPQYPQHQPQNPHYPPPQPQHPTWSTPHYHPSTTTTPVPVIKNEQYFGDNGSYRYEYQIADGTHVGEEGYFLDPKDEESIVKKGWYSYKGADGKTYTVTYWADKTGYHAFGDHLPTPPPVPQAIQQALDKKEKEEAEKNKPQYYPTTQKPIYYPTYYPTQQPTYYPPQQPTYYPSQPSYGK